MRCPSCGFPPINRCNMLAVSPKRDKVLVRAKVRKPLVSNLAQRGETVLQSLVNFDENPAGTCVRLKSENGGQQQSGRRVFP